MKGIAKSWSRDATYRAALHTGDLRSSVSLNSSFNTIESSTESGAYQV